MGSQRQAYLNPPHYHKPLTADQQKANGHTPAKKRTNLWNEDRDHKLSAVTGTVLGGYFLDTILEVRSRQRGVGWVYMLAGINSPKQSASH